MAKYSIQKKPDNTGDNALRRVKFFRRQWVTLKAVWFYIAILFAGLFGLIVLMPPYYLKDELIFSLLSLLNIELAVYRYNEWKPEKSKLYILGTRAVVDFVHNEGIVRYKRKGSEYALYSNKIKSDKPIAESQNIHGS